jgi:hypothetical protein
MVAMASARRRYTILARTMAAVSVGLLMVFVLHSHGVRQLYYTLCGLISR